LSLSAVVEGVGRVVLFDEWVVVRRGLGDLVGEGGMTFGDCVVVDTGVKGSESLVRKSLAGIGITQNSKYHRICLVWTWGRGQT